MGENDRVLDALASTEGHVMDLRLPCGHPTDAIWLPGSDAWCGECMDFVHIPTRQEREDA